MDTEKLFHKAPRIIQDKMPAQQVGIVVGTNSSVWGLPKALNYLYQLMTESDANLTSSVEQLASDFDWYEGD